MSDWNLWEIMEMESKKNPKLDSKECKFCKCQSYVRPSCNQVNGDSKLVREDSLVVGKTDKTQLVGKSWKDLFGKKQGCGKLQVGKSKLEEPK